MHGFKVDEIKQFLNKQYCGFRSVSAIKCIHIEYDVASKRGRNAFFCFLSFFFSFFFFIYIYRNCETFEICPLFKHLRADECLNIRGTWIRIRYLWTLSVKLYQTYNFISLEDPLLHFIRREGDIHRWIEPLFSLPYIDRIRTGHR